MAEAPPLGPESYPLRDNFHSPYVANKINLRYNANMSALTKKLYCYVDETGQDVGSKVFIIVAVVVISNVDAARERLQELEAKTRIGKIKWHKSDYKYRIKFMEEFLLGDNKDLRIYFLKVRKPVFYYLPTVEILQRAIAANNASNTQAIICIDGLDKFSGKKYTNALRTKTLKIKLAKGARDESEALIRLADRWAGCIRMALSGNEDCEALMARAEKKGILKEV